MAIDPNIALGVRPLELPNQLAQYGQIAQIQNAQNQNAMAQYQLATAQREQESVNALNQAYAKAYDPKTGQIDANALRQSLAGGGFGSKLPAVEKGLLELGKLKTETQAAETKLLDDKLKQSRSFLDTINPLDPKAPQQYLAWHEANHKDPILGPALAARGVTQEQSLARIQQAIQAGPQAFADLINQSKLGTEKFMELNKPHYITENLGGTSKVSALPGLGGTPTVVSTTKKTMTPGEAEANAIARAKLAQDATGVVYQEDNQGNVIALPSKLKAGEVPTARLAVAPGGGFQPLQGKPSEAVGKEQMSINQQRAIVKGAIDAVTATPDAFGMTRGLMPESLGGRMASSEENQARSYLFNVVSGVIKERAGTAQSAAEAETLARFLPQPTDAADEIKDKMLAFDKYLVAKESGTTKKRGGPTIPTLTPVDQQALQWANSNPADPRAAAIKQRLGQ
jgi:hypothetical protein